MSHVTTAERPTAAPAPIANDAPAQLPRAVQPPLAGGGRILPIIPQTLAEVMQLAQLIARSNAAPDCYRMQDGAGPIDTDMVCVAILAGLEVGLPPMAAVAGIVVLDGTPTIFGDARDGLVAASGLLVDMKEEMVVDAHGIVVSATCTVWRKDRPTPITQTVTMAQAELAGWLENDAWKTNPNRMAQFRAKGWANRDAFPDVLKGLKNYDEERDYLDVTGRGSATTAPPEPKRSDFMPPKDAPAAATTEQQIEPVGDQPEETEGWPLYDETGETVGAYPAVQWIDAFERMTSPLDDTRWLAAVDNNRETAAGVVEEVEGSADKMDAIKAKGLSTSFVFAKAIAQKSMQAGER